MLVPAHAVDLLRMHLSFVFNVVFFRERLSLFTDRAKISENYEYSYDMSMEQIRDKKKRKRTATRA